MLGCKYYMGHEVYRRDYFANNLIMICWSEFGRRMITNFSCSERCFPDPRHPRDKSTEEQPEDQWRWSGRLQEGIHQMAFHLKTRNETFAYFQLWEESQEENSRLRSEMEATRQDLDSTRQQLDSAIQVN